MADRAAFFLILFDLISGRKRPYAIAFGNILLNVFSKDFFLSFSTKRDSFYFSQRWAEVLTKVFKNHIFLYALSKGFLSSFVDASRLALLSADVEPKFS